MKEFIETVDNKRQWHPNFLKYTEFIVGHENYKGLFYEREVDKKEKWVITGKSENGQQWKIWWDAQFGLGIIAKIRLTTSTRMQNRYIGPKEIFAQAPNQILMCIYWSKMSVFHWVFSL